MSDSRLADYLAHIEQAASDAMVFVEAFSKDDFLHDKRTQQAVFMSLIQLQSIVLDGAPIGAGFRNYRPNSGPMSHQAEPLNGPW